MYPLYWTPSKEGIFMRYSHEYKLECIELYRQGIWPETPEGIITTNFRKIIRYWVRIEEQNALNEKKYGLVWEEHSEKVDEMLEHNIPVFVENVERKIEVNENEAYNFLLEGDNLHSLKLLEKTHKGKIDVIYRNDYTQIDT